MKLHKKYLLPLILPLALFASCDGGGDPPEEPGVTYAFTIGTPVVNGNDAVINVTYTVEGVAVTETAGIRYAVQGSTDYSETGASALDDRSFTTTLTNLRPGTSYVAYAYAVTSGGERYVSAACKTFTTNESGPDPDPDQFLWAELPVMEERENVVYVTHYVSSDGQSDASATTPGRVRNYTLCYDIQKHQPLWAAYPMHGWYDGGAGRNDSWRYDPDLLSQYQPNLSNKYDGIYHRGHQVASSDRQKSKPMNRQTFYYSNMSPQIQNEFNGGIWNSLEIKIQDNWGFPCSDTLYVVTGGAFTGTQRSTTDKDGKVIPVPSHYYKVILSSKTGNTGKSISQLAASELKCVGFWLDHFGYGSTDKISVDEMESVATIEELTGFEFFPMLSEEAKSVKNSYNASDWGM